MGTVPTFVIGVGRTGIDLLGALEQVTEQRGNRELFDFVAIDTDPAALERVPDDTLRIKLDHNDAFTPEDCSRYPYLTAELGEQLDGAGAHRRRPVGRYKLDSRGASGYSSTYDQLYSRFRSHLEEHIGSLTSENRWVNVYCIHSTGGGTGSGIFPLLTAMLSPIVDWAMDQHGAGTYVGGVAITPELQPGAYLPGPETYYLNTYAALNDLDKLASIDSDGEPLELVSYARTFGTMRRSEFGSTSFELQEPPFDDYWLYGVNEGRIQGQLQTGGESQRDQVDQTIARSLHAISQLPSVENWATTDPKIGSIDQSEMQVPHREVMEYCQYRADLEAKRTRRNADIPAEIDYCVQHQEELRTLKEDLDEDVISDSRVNISVRERIAEEFVSGRSIVEKNTAEDIEQVLDEIKEEYGLEGRVAATSVLRSKLMEDHGIPRVEKDWKDTVTELWSKYDMTAKPVYGGDTVTTIEGKSAATQEFVNDAIDRYINIVENWDPGLVGQIQDSLPPVGPFESDKERAEGILAQLRDARDELTRVQSEWRRVSEMRRAIEDHRRDIRECIDERIDERNKQITSLTTEREELERDIRRLEADIESIRASLAAEQVSQQLIIPPIETDRLDELDPETADETLTDIASYVDEALVTEENIERVLRLSLDYCQADSNDVIQRNFSETDYQPHTTTVSERWYRFHETNTEILDAIDIAINTTIDRMSGQEIDYLSDPYRIEFVSFCRAGPIPALTLYQQLDKLATDDVFAGPEMVYEDYRQAFAYPEWYNQEIREAFEILTTVTVPQPPEPDLSSNENVDLLGGSGLDRYLWEGIPIGEDENDRDGVFRGWQNKLVSNGVDFSQFQRASPPQELKEQWLQDTVDWEEVVESYRESIREQTDLDPQRRQPSPSQQSE